jgi:hypothetical protein
VEILETVPELLKIQLVFHDHDAYFNRLSLGLYRLIRPSDQGFLLHEISSHQRIYIIGNVGLLSQAQ